MVCVVSGVLFQGWDVGTLGNTLSGCVTQDPKVDASEASAIHPTHTNVCVWPTRLPSVVKTESELYLRTQRVSTFHTHTLV